MNLPLFLVLAALIIAAALGVILQRNPVRSALSLVVTLFLLAVVYIFLDAHIVAALQIIVYAGAILVLFLFVIMLLNLQVEVPDTGRTGIKAAAGVAAAIFVLEVVRVVHQSHAGTASPSVAPGFGTTEALAARLFTHFLLPFEITSVLLLVAIVGAVVLAKKHVS